MLKRLKLIQTTPQNNYINIISVIYISNNMKKNKI